MIMFYHYTIMMLLFSWIRYKFHWLYFILFIQCKFSISTALIQTVFLAILCNTLLREKWGIKGKDSIAFETITWMNATNYDSLVCVCECACVCAWVSTTGSGATLLLPPHSSTTTYNQPYKTYSNSTYSPQVLLFHFLCLLFSTNDPQLLLQSDKYALMNWWVFIATRYFVIHAESLTDHQWWRSCIWHLRLTDSKELRRISDLEWVFTCT